MQFISFTNRHLTSTITCCFKDDLKHLPLLLTKYSRRLPRAESPILLVFCERFSLWANPATLSVSSSEVQVAIRVSMLLIWVYPYYCEQHMRCRRHHVRDPCSMSTCSKMTSSCDYATETEWVGRACLFGDAWISKSCGNQFWRNWCANTAAKRKCAVYPQTWQWSILIIWYCRFKLWRSFYEKMGLRELLKISRICFHLQVYVSGHNCMHW